MDLGESEETTAAATEVSDGEVGGTVVEPTVAAVQVENQYQELTHTASATAAVVEAGTHTVSLS